MAIANVFKKKYKLASKGQRSRILDEFIRMTGFNRNYGSQLLRAQHKHSTHRQLRLRTRYLNLYTNYFQPSMILITKYRQGAKTSRKYDAPMTPFQRALNSEAVSPDIKRRIQAIYETLNPAELRRNVDRCQTALVRGAAPIRAPIEKVNVSRRKEVRHTKPANQREKAFDPFTKRQRMEEMRRAQKLLRPQNTARHTVQEVAS